MEGLGLIEGSLLSLVFGFQVAENKDEINLYYLK
jgi:hypothetical protein